MLHFFAFHLPPSRKNVGRDVGKLSLLHKNHVLALENALKDETKRLAITRQELTRITLARASDAAAHATAREQEAANAGKAVKELQRLKIICEKAVLEKRRAEEKAAAAAAEGKRLSDQSRLERAKNNGVKARLAESEAENALLRRDLENIQAKQKLGSGTLDGVGRENCILRAENESLKTQIDEMRIALKNVNKNIYGAKAAEYCMRLSLKSTDIVWSRSRGTMKENARKTITKGKRGGGTKPILKPWKKS